MSYRLIDSNAMAEKHPEVNDMSCVFADLPNGLDGSFITQEWISCSERLPEKSGIYLVTLKTDGVAHFESEFPNGFVYVSTYEAVIMNWGYGSKNVIAWMPLPEPYRG